MTFLYRFFIIILCIISLPILIGITIVIRIFSGPPIFFSQKRVGKNGKTFTMFKFRTMIAGAEKQQEKLKKRNEADGPAFKIRNDPRFIPIGKWLSHTGLDELPQLYNVLKGDMSLIGPRPLPVFEANKLEAWQKKRHLIKPGIISPWVLNGYHKNTFTEWMKSDIEYANNKSIRGDLGIFFATIRFMVGLCIKAIDR